MQYGAETVILSEIPADVKPTSQLRFDCDTTTTRLRRKINMLIFLLASNRVEWKQARAIRRSRIVVVSQSVRVHQLTLTVFSEIIEGWFLRFYVIKEKREK